ncbi:MAG TPA: TPM domain-containing protein [Candidatus Binatia bacterium]|nr:TPM domain-containing protein [Candidatus Binatia bacterium]
MIFFAVALFAALFLNSASIASEVPALNATINDFAGMMPQASIHDLEVRLARFRTETSHPVVIVTVKSLDGESIDSFGRRTFKNLPFASADLEKAVLLVVARKERQVGFQAGPALRDLFPEPDASRKLYDHVALYFDGLRPDLGIYGAVQYLFRVIKGDIRVGSQSEEEKLEETSLSGRGAGAIFAAFLAPVLALFVGGLWGIYATQYGVQRGIRLLMGAIFSGATAKIVAGLMSALGGFSDNLWYFIMALSIPLGVFGSLTEFWMSGDWRGIPRVKGRKRKPEDHMGI